MRDDVTMQHHLICHWLGACTKGSLHSQCIPCTFLQLTQKRHPIARPQGRAMGVFCEFKRWIKFQLSSKYLLSHCIWYHAIFDWNILRVVLCFVRWCNLSVLLDCWCLFGSSPGLEHRYSSIIMVNYSIKWNLPSVVNLCLIIITGFQLFLSLRT